MSEYSKRGDDGTTSLLGGDRRPKDDLRVDAYGTVDELSAALGVVVARGCGEWTAELLRAVQQDLFALGALLASPGLPPGGARLDDGRVGALERAITEIHGKLPPLRAFIRPGGAEAAALLHTARTVCRRAERRVVTLHRSEPIDPLALRYLNRLADLLFSLARLANLEAGRPDEPLAGG